MSNLPALQSAILSHMRAHPEDAAVVMHTAVSGLQESVGALSRQAAMSRLGITSALLLMQPRIDEGTRSAAVRIVMEGMGAPTCELEREFAEKHSEKPA